MDKLSFLPATAVPRAARRMASRARTHGRRQAASRHGIVFDVELIRIDP